MRKVLSSSYYPSCVTLTAYEARRCDWYRARGFLSAIFSIMKFREKKKEEKKSGGMKIN